MKHLIASTAAALILSTGAYAESQSMGKMDSGIMEYSYDSSKSLSASDLMGMRIYASETKPANMIDDGGEANWDDIGEINDIILSRAGQVEAAILGVGGFLGMGEKDIAVDMSRIKIVRETGDSDDYFLVVTASRDMLENAEAFERSEDNMTMKPMAKTDSMRQGDMDRAKADNSEMADGAWTPFVRPDVDSDGFSMASKTDLTADNLTGTRVYSTNGEDIGEVSEIMLNNDGSVARMMLDIGGFFGLGETEVPVSYDELNIQRSDDGDEFRVFIDATETGLEERVSHDS